MTVSTTTNKIIYNGLIGQSVFAYNFRVDNKVDMEVYLAGEIIPDGDWTIDGLGNASGGNVTLNSVLAADQTVTLLREVPETQQVDYQPFDAFPAETHEGALDKLTMLVQQLQEQVNRAPTQPVDSTLDSYNLGTPVASKLIQYRADLTGQEASIYTVQELIDNSGGDDIQNTPPSNPKPGDGWWDQDVGKPYTWYEDGTSNQWVERVPTPNFADTFDAKLKGYAATGVHDGYTGDLDDLKTNSCWFISPANVTNEPTDFVGDGFIVTERVAPNSGTQTIYGRFGADSWKQWMRADTNGTWGAWKLVVDGGAFPQRLAGYEDTGLHTQFAGDLNTVIWDSCYHLVAGVTNIPTDYIDSSEGFLITDVHSSSANWATQRIIGMLSHNEWKQWQRSQSNGVWQAWKLVVDGSNKKLGARVASNSAPFWLSGMTCAKGATGIYTYTFDTALVGSQYVVNAITAGSSNGEIPTISLIASTGFQLGMRDTAGALVDVEHSVSVIDYN